ncbi:MAG: hypothetical protein AAFX99_19150 [Myxococcota bacterium]
MDLHIIHPDSRQVFHACLESIWHPGPVRNACCRRASSRALFALHHPTILGASARHEVKRVLTGEPALSPHLEHLGRSPHRAAVGALSVLLGVFMLGRATVPEVL